MIPSTWRQSMILYSFNSILSDDINGLTEGRKTNNYIPLLDVMDCTGIWRLLLIEIDTDCIQAYFALCKNKYEFWREPTSKFCRNILSSSKLKQQVRSISDSFLLQGGDTNYSFPHLSHHHHRHRQHSGDPQRSPAHSSQDTLQLLCGIAGCCWPHGKFRPINLQLRPYYNVTLLQRSISTTEADTFKLFRTQAHWDNYFYLTLGLPEINVCFHS